MIALAYLVLALIAAVPAIAWHDKGEYVKRDAALTLPWAVLSAALIPRVIVLCQGHTMHDAAYISADRALGFNVPAIMAWAASSPALTAVLDFSYWLLDLFMLAA